MSERSRARGGGGQVSVMQTMLSLAPGGAERAVIDLVTRSEGAVRNAVCCLDEAGEWASTLRDRGIPVQVLARRPGFHPSLGLRLALAARRYGADVLHCHQYSPFVYGEIAHMLHPGLRVVFTEHGRLADARPSRRRSLANALLTRLPARVVAVSDDQKRYMVAEGFPAGRISVIRNAIEPGTPPGAVQRREARAALNAAGHEFVVGTAARFDPVKSLATLVEAFAGIAARVPQAVLVLMGDGAERPRLERLAAALGVSGRVRFTGMRRDVRRLLPGLDLFVNCSTTEGTSLTILEAMAAALPVVATSVGGNPEIVVDGVTGLLVPAESSQALGRAVRQLAADGTTAMAFGRAGRRRVEVEFSIERVVERYVRIYREEAA